MVIVTKKLVQRMSGDGRSIFETFWECQDCHARVDENDNYCRGCGGAF